MAYIIPYKMGSRSAKSLAQSLRIKRSSGSKTFRPFTKVINWGNSTLNLRGRNLKIANRPESIANATNKLKALTIMRNAGVSTIDFTTSMSAAFNWAEEGHTVYGRSMLNAHSGRGIKILTSETDFPTLPLYTRGILKAHEYRVHVAFNEAIDVSKKKRRNGESTNDFIKNLDNGWVFCRDNLNPPPLVISEAIKAVRALGLDFGAVDVLYRERENKVYILEVNTAAGIEGTTLTKYTERFQRWINS